LDVGLAISSLSHSEQISRRLIGKIGLLYLHFAAHDLLITVDILQLYPVGDHLQLLLFKPIANIFFRGRLAKISHFLIAIS
jgi:hypothetical protein